MAQKIQIHLFAISKCEYFKNIFLLLFRIHKCNLLSYLGITKLAVDYTVDFFFPYMRVLTYKMHNITQIWSDISTDEKH